MTTANQDLEETAGERKESQSEGFFFSLPPTLLKFLFAGLWVLIAGFFLLRFVHLGADFIHEKDYSRDGVLYTDEGWYANNALYYFRTGDWYQEGGLNFAVNLPTLQVMHFVSFTFLGPNILAARTTIIVSLLLLLGIVWFILWHFEDKWTATLAVFWMTTNLFLLLYSRFALGEIPMTLFATACLALAAFSDGKRGWYLAPLAGLAFALAFYTKTSAVFAFPLMMLAIFVRCWDEKRDRWLKPLAAGAVFAACFVIHYLALARPHWEDYQYFHSLNVGMNAKTELGVVVEYGLHMFDKMRIIDKMLYRVLIYTVPLLLIFVKSYRRNPLVLFSLMWLAEYIVMFSFYVNLRPRYWVPLVVPASILIAIGLKTFLQESRGAGFRNFLQVDLRRKIAFAGSILYLIAILGSFGRNVSGIVDYYRNIEYTFAKMCAEVKEHLDADPASRGILLGHFSTTMALYEELLPVNDRFNTEPLEYQIEKYKPRYLIVESTVWDRDYADQWETVRPEEGGRRLKALHRYYDEIELVKAFDVFSNYQGWPVSFYRLHPKDNVDWNLLESLREEGRLE